MRNAIFLIALLTVGAVACASSKVVRASSSSCAPLPELVGTWRSYRLSSLGPAWMRVTFNCDCTARVVSQLLFMRYVEELPYRVEDGVIIFARRSAETRWPYSFATGALVVREAPDEQYRYTRSTEVSCRMDAPPH